MPITTRSTEGPPGAPSHLTNYSNGDLMAELRSMNKRFDEKFTNIAAKIDKNIADLSNRLNDISGELDMVKKVTSVRLNKLEADNNNLHIEINRINKLCEILICGVPCIQGEIISTIFDKIATCIGFIQKNSICHYARIKTPGTSPKKQPLILVTFNNKFSKKLFFQQYLAFIKMQPLKLTNIDIDSDNPIYINENLTKHHLKLLLIAKQLKKCGKIHNVVTVEGNVCIYITATDKKYVIIRDEAELEKLS